MRLKIGKILLVEGIDSVGKGTQCKLLAEALTAMGWSVEQFSAPNYSSVSGMKVKNYLNGMYGVAGDVHPVLASSLYTLDRVEQSAKVKKAVAEGKIVILDRWTASNLAFQGAKIEDDAERYRFVTSQARYEYDLLGIPRPHRTFFLDADPDTARYMMSLRTKCDSSDKQMDQHESNLELLRKAHKVYGYMCDKMPAWRRIVCLEKNEMRSIESISRELIGQAVAFLNPDIKL